MKRLSTVLIIAAGILFFGWLALLPQSAVAQTEPPVRPTLTPRPTNVPPTTATPQPVPNDQATPLPARITGTVIDQRTGAPVAGIAVQVGDGVVQSDANGNYNRDGLAPGDYSVSLRIDPSQGTPAQGPIVVRLLDGQVVVQHLAFTSPVPTVATATIVTTAPALPVAIPGPAMPSTLPATGTGYSDVSIALLVIAGVVFVAGLGLRRVGV